MGDKAQSPPARKFVPAAVLLGSLAWAALIWLLTSTRPFEAGFRWLFFLAWFSAVAASALPVVAFLNRRFPGRLPASQRVIIRQACWLGLFAATLAWLQIGRLVSFALVLLLAIGISLIEAFLRLRERSLWRP